MLESLNFLRELTVLSVIVRLLAATVSGGLIGLEREYKRRPAGFRTHILICLGACMTTMTSQFLGIAMGNTVELSRLGAQVVAGIGFIGAGTIIVTRQQRVKGLTTAAGLWACAILGLSIGAGFFESAAIFVSLILLAELLFVKLEYKLLQSARENILYVEYTGAACLDGILSYFKAADIRVNSMEITRPQTGNQDAGNAIFHIRSNKKVPMQSLCNNIYAISGVLSVEEL
jgi:putative Mg2+ transporter-C (MgtC) family protein